MKLQKFPHGLTSQWSLGANIDEYRAYIEDSVSDESTVDLVVFSVVAGICEPIDPFGRILGDEPLLMPSFEMFTAASPDLLLVSFALKTKPRKTPEIDWFEMDQTPEAVQFQISHRREQACFDPTTAWELARIVTPVDHYSIIHAIQTELTFEDNDIRWSRGDSAFHTRDFGGGIGQLDVSWAIKLESLDAVTNQNPYAFRAMAITTPANWLNEIPGSIHPEIAPWNEMLFLWGSDHFIRLRCPANSLVSLWIYFRDPALGGGALAAAGMLKAQTQIINSDRAFRNITRMHK